MKFKRTFHVFVDNFSSTYKLLVYKLIVWLVFIGISVGVMYPTVDNITGTTVYTDLMKNVQDLISVFLNGNDLTTLYNAAIDVREGIKAIWVLFESLQGEVIFSLILIALIYMVQQFFQGLGHYTSALLINDRMGLHARSSFTGTLIKNLGNACVYNVIYVPISFLYDIICTAGFGALLYFAYKQNVPILLLVLLASIIFVAVICVKMTFTTDWLPALVCSKMKNGKAMCLSFRRKKEAIPAMLSNYAVLCLFIMAINVGAVLLTFGAGLLITIPACYIVLQCFQLVTYYGDNNLAYFIDKDTVVKPVRTKEMTREEFFRGENG